MALTQQQIAYIVVALLSGFAIGMIFGSLSNPGGDLDGDTVPDLHDNCPFLPNPDQRDDNNNRSGDVCDALFGETPVGQMNFDGDNKPNSSDRCPWHVNNDCTY